MSGGFSRLPVLLAILSCLVLLCSPALAEEEMEQQTGISLTPRFWLSSIDPLTGAVAKKEAYLLPMYGATLAVRPSGASNYQFLMTGMYGSGEGDVIWPGQSLDTEVVTGLGPVPASFVTTEARGAAEAERVDLEFLVRRLFPDKWFSLFFGPRFATWKETTSGSVGYKLDVGPIPPFDLLLSQEETYDLTIDLDSKLYGFELGLGTVAEMSDSGRHLLFSNFIFSLAYTEWKAKSLVLQDGVPDPSLSEIVGIPDGEISGHHLSNSLDANLGYLFSGDTLGLSFRYRVFMLSEENALEQTQFTTLHGPELGIVYQF